MLLLRYYLWIAPHLLVGLLLLCFLLRKLGREFPVFTSYLLFDTLRFVLSVALTLHSPPLINAYRWGVLAIGNTVDGLIILAVIYEITTKLTFSRPSIVSSLRWVFSATTAALILIAAVASATFRDATLAQALRFSDTLDFCSSLIRVGVLLSLLVFARALQISWTGWPAGITLGLGVAASIDLAGSALRGAFGKRALIPVDITQMAGFHLCVVIWIAYLFFNQPQSRSGERGLKRADLESWDQHIEQFVRR